MYNKKPIFTAVVIFTMIVCCACSKGAVTGTGPTGIVTQEPSVTPSPTAAPEPSVTPSPTATPEPSITPSPTAAPEPTKALQSAVLPGGGYVTPDNIPVIDGALALEPFYDAVFAELLGMQAADAKLFLPCNNTPSAYQNLIAGRADMIFCALPSDDQVADAKKAGVEFEYHTILSGGFVFFVNTDNPVNSVTQEQLKGIVSGKITNWKEVGGKDEPIVLFQRNEGSGSQSGLYRYVLPKGQVMAPHVDHVDNDMMGSIDHVADYDNGKGAISYSYYYYVVNMHSSSEIKLLGIDGVVPSDETISKGQYPFLNFSQIVTRKDLPKDSIVREIIAWLQAGNGARIARENGYVPYEGE